MWLRIILTEKQLSEDETERLIMAFQKVYDRHKSQVANMALFAVAGDNCIFYLNANASKCCSEIKELYSAEPALPIKGLRRLAGDIGPQIFTS